MVGHPCLRVMFVTTMNKLTLEKLMHNYLIRLQRSVADSRLSWPLLAGLSSNGIDQMMKINGF
jgi:hypothetical protein